MNGVELSDIVQFVWYINQREPLNGDDIEDIMRALKEWNGEDEWNNAIVKVELLITLSLCTLVFVVNVGVGSDASIT